jgi:soluble lytic murein transglycosylase
LNRKKKKLLWLLSGVAASLVLLLVLAAIAVWNNPNWFVADGDYASEIAAAAKRHGLDPNLVRALVYQESRFKADKLGKKGEIGLMQVLPKGAAAEWARVNKRRIPSNRELFNIRTNLDIGCWYLSRAKRRWRDYDHGLELALAEYNAGPTKAREWAPPDKRGEVIPRIRIASTKKYVTDILNRYRSYAEDETDGKNK